MGGCLWNASQKKRICRRSWKAGREFVWRVGGGGYSRHSMKIAEVSGSERGLQD